MRKRAYFDMYWGEGWPALDWLEDYFLVPSEQRWSRSAGNDGASLELQGADGTGHLQPNRGRIDVDLAIWANLELGVLLIYSKWGGGLKLTYSSKGDLRRLREWIRSSHGTPLPVGLFIPFEAAWKAVKEFVETEGELPESIEWIANHDLPPNTFPEP